MTRSLSSGFFITFEGGEGTGKSTQIARLADHLRARGLDVVTTREPGGSPGAEALRHVLLSGAARGYGEPDLEAVLFAAGRSDHLVTLVLPALEKGAVVICDRFHDSTRVYQGLGGSDPALIDFLEHVAIGDLRPDLTIVMDLPAEIGLQRAAERRGGAVPDRFEGDALLVHEARRKAFLAIAANEPQRCIVVDGARSVSEVAKEIAFVVDDRLDDGRLASGSDDTRTFSA